MLWKIWGFRDGDCEECRIMGCGALAVLLELTFGGNYRLHLQGRKNQRAGKKVSSN
jgi:hypothetical protein